MKIACEVIRDLLPLYHDDVCSGESRRIVEEHLQECAECRRELQLMDEAWSAPHPQVEDEAIVQAASFAWKKGRRRAFRKGALIAAVIAAVVLVCTVVFLLSRSAERQVEGRILEAREGDTAGSVSLVIQAEDGEELGLLLSDGTDVFSLLDGGVSNDFLEGRFSDRAVVSVYLTGPWGRMETEDGRTLPVYHARQITLCGYLTPEQTVLPDGTTAQIWQELNAFVYKLADGTELLRVSLPPDPGAAWGGGENQDALSGQAQARIRAFFEEQGLLYDEQAELEKAYEAYCEAPEDFDARSLSQETYIVASSDAVLYFRTSVLLPVDGAEVTEVCVGTAFERETGEPVENQALFSCPPQELIQTLLDGGQITDPALREEMAEAFDPRGLVFLPDCLEVNFPRGSLPSQPYTMQLIVEYEEPLTDVLEEWAAPTASGIAG